MVVALDSIEEDVVTLRVRLAGATGWAGSELARAIAGAADLDLVAAVARKHSGRVLGDVLGESRLTAPYPRPHADGALLAIRNVVKLAGLHRGLDSVLEP